MDVPMLPFPTPSGVTLQTTRDDFVDWYHPQSGLGPAGSQMHNDQAQYHALPSGSTSAIATPSDGAFFNGWVNPVVHLATGDRFSQLLEAKLDLDHRQLGERSSNLLGVHDPTPVAPHASTYWGAGSSAAPSSILPTSRDSSGGLHGAGYEPMSTSVNYGSHLAVENALHDMALTYIAPDLVAPMPPQFMPTWNDGNLASGSRPTRAPPTEPAPPPVELAAPIAPMATSDRYADLTSTFTAGHTRYHAEHKSRWNWMGGNAPYVEGDNPPTPAPTMTPAPYVTPQPVSLAQSSFHYESQWQQPWHGMGPMPAASMSGSTEAQRLSNGSAVAHRNFEPMYQAIQPGSWTDVMFASQGSATHADAMPQGEQQTASLWHATPAGVVDAMTTRDPAPTPQPLSELHVRPLIPDLSSDIASSSPVPPQASSSRRSSVDLPAAKITAKRKKISSNPAKAAPAATMEEEEKKVIIACCTCRARKLRCDGVRPRCYHCSKRPQDICEYDMVLRRRGPGKNNKPKGRARSRRKVAAGADDAETNGDLAAVGASAAYG